MVEIFILVIALSIFTLVVAILYSKRIHTIHEKYVEAKRVVDDIILSFNRQLQRQENQIETSTHRLDALSSRDELLVTSLEKQEREVGRLVESVQSISALKKAVTRIDTLDNRISEIEAMKNTLLERVSKIEKQRLRQEAETKIETAIPIKREKALAPLTETELIVLEFLAAEGGKTAPEIKERIDLSREHTARLMKKLYEKGYLERRTNKIPFTYNLKEEMQKILKNPEQKG